MRLSIIIPVYNVEKYISKCLDSLLHQDIPHSEYEIIIVNDGSPDDSDKVVQNYLDKYHNIIYICQDNKGLSGARNTGINHAEGNYIWFVDSDDTITPNCLAALLDYAETLDLDFCEFPYNEIIGNNSRLMLPNSDPTNRYSDHDVFFKTNQFSITAWCNIVKRNILIDNNLKYVEGIYHEDLEFNIRLLFFCKRKSYYISEVGLYNYVLNREGSTMTNTKLTHILKRIDSYIYIIKSIKENFKYNPQRCDYSFYIHRMANDIMAYNILPLIEKAEIPNKQEFFRDKVVSENLTYNVKVMNGIPKCKFWILSLFRTNYRVSLSILSLFNYLVRLKQGILEIVAKQH